MTGLATPEQAGATVTGDQELVDALSRCRAFRHRDYAMTR